MLNTQDFQKTKSFLKLPNKKCLFVTKCKAIGGVELSFFRFISPISALALKVPINTWQVTPCTVF